MSLPCPSCRGTMVSPPQFGDAVSGCRSCCGLWLSNEASVGVVRGNLHPEVVALAARVDAHSADAQGGDGRDYRHAAPSGRRCPVCHEALAKAVVSRQRIELDVCAHHGTWFDRHELRTVLFALTIEQETEAVAREQQSLIEEGEHARVRHMMTVPEHPRARLTREVIDWVLDR